MSAGARDRNRQVDADLPTEQRQEPGQPGCDHCSTRPTKVDQNGNRLCHTHAPRLWQADLEQQQRTKDACLELGDAIGTVITLTTSAT